MDSLVNAAMMVDCIDESFTGAQRIRISANFSIKRFNQMVKVITKRFEIKAAANKVRGHNERAAQICDSAHKL